jgi:hypothetical protein
MIKQNKYNESLVANLDKASEFYSQMAVYYSESESLFDSVKTEKVSAEYNTIEYCSGVYTGYIYDGMPWGEGTFTSKNGKKVFAKFYGYHAIGKNVKVDGDNLYCGELIITSGEIKLFGFGQLIGTDITIEGNFSCDILHGPAKVFYHHIAEIYEGIYVYGKRDGPGKLILANGGFIEGIWNEEVCSSLAKIGFADNSVFTGIQFEGKPRMGKLEYANGDIYEGNFHPSGLPLGDGQLITNSNILITGFFWRGKILSGVLKWPDGRITKVFWAEKYACIIPEEYYQKYQMEIDNGTYPNEEIERQSITI